MNNGSVTVQSASVSERWSYERVQADLKIERPSAAEQARQAVPDRPDVQAAPDAQAGALEDDALDPRTRLARDLLEHMFGMSVRLLAEIVQDGRCDCDCARCAPRTDEQRPVVPDGPGAPDPQEPLWTLDVRVDRVRVQRDVVTARAEGTLTPHDGATVTFTADMFGARELVEVSSLSITATNRPKDPLVINFAGGFARLGQATRDFDIDADGRPDRVHVLDSGSGYLAVDRDGDGRIGDGRELFGALTGDGWSELAALDSDGDGFIDEDDDGWGRLRVWVQHPGGHDRLLTLAQAGVGAIALANAPTRLGLDAPDGTEAGRVRSTGIWISEDATRVGSVQQIDLYA